MALRTIVKIGDDVLRKKCRPITEFDKKLHILLDDMYETLKSVEGVGLAGPQVGYLRRVFIIETEETGLLECINPEIIETLGIQEGDEACLSVPNRSEVVKRPAVVRFSAYNRNGEKFEKVVKKLAARAICHENDHLDGVLYIDRVEKDKFNG